MATLGLGDYGSSDEGEDIGEPIVVRTAASDRSSTAEPILEKAAGGSKVKYAQSAFESLPQSVRQDMHDDTSAIGPALDPQSSVRMANPYASGTASASQSPYTSERLLIRDLTMPPTPNFDIPQSPPGSPSAIVSSKFARFLELKKQGVHFNERLEKSSALQNPSLLQKMMKFAGVEEQDQFASTLPPSLAIPTSFPAWAYADELAKTQQAMTKKLEEDRVKVQREAIDFVPAAGSAASSRGATPGATGGRGVKGSAAERVMAGLNRDRSGSPAGPNERNFRDAERSAEKRRSPVVTGTSVIAVKFKDGVVIAADNLASYGSLARFTDVKRLRRFNDQVVVGFGGDVSDMQYLDRLLNSLDIRENYTSAEPETTLNAKNLHTYMSKVMYKRRSDFNPLWNHILVAGLN
ncbi:hypothetical protein B0A49_06517, partial [Cryomyces minteri]